MLTVDVLQQALSALRELGIQVRLEWLGGIGGGTCEFAGRQWLFLDLAQTPDEQLALALACLRGQPGINSVSVNERQGLVLERRKSA
jgi:hypothetical protein